MRTTPYRLAYPKVAGDTPFERLVEKAIFSN